MCKRTKYYFDDIGLFAGCYTSIDVTWTKILQAILEDFNPCYNKVILYESLIILPDSYWYQNKQGFLALFF